MAVPIAFFAVVLIWSTTPLAIQWSALGAGFAFAVMARMAIGVALAAAILALWRIGFPLHSRARRTYLASGLGLFGAMSLTYWGAQFIGSGLISVLFGLSPLITSLMAALWLGERALTVPKLAGLGLGLLGLGTVFAAGSGLGGDRAWLGMIALLGAVTIYSGSMVWVKRIGDDSPPLAITAGALGVSLPLFALVWALAEGRVPEHLEPRAEAAILYLGAFGSVLGFALFYFLVARLEAGRVALITLMTPVIALLLGSIANGESVPPRVWLGTGLICSGLSVYQWGAMLGIGRRREEVDMEPVS